MTPREILEKYGLKTDVKSIKERIRWIGAYKVASSLTDDPLMILNIKMEIQQADLDLLCEMAERVEKVEELLGLYRKSYNILDEYDKSATIQQKHDILNQFNDIEKQIKTFEDKLK